jgi:hypothetical protein
MRNLLIILVMFLVTSPVVKGQGNDSLIMYLTMDEESGGIIQDLSQFGNHGELKGGAELVDGGKFGKALALNGQDAYVEVLDSDSFAGTEISLEAWFKTESSQNFPIIWKEKTASGGSFWARVEPSDNRIRCLFRDKNDVTAIPIAKAAYNDGQWHHFAATLGDGVARIYIDSNMDNEVTSDVGEFDSVMNLGIGVRYLDALDTFSDGFIDEVRVWKRPLDKDEIKANMNKSKGDFAVVSSAGKLGIAWGDIKWDKSIH